MTTAALLLSSCAVPIKDEQFCSPLPGDLGAVCDNFLTSNQLILSKAAWDALQKKWGAVECTSAVTIGDLKQELEKLCSVAKCDYATKQLITEGLQKIEALGRN